MTNVAGRLVKVTDLKIRALRTGTLSDVLSRIASCNSHRINHVKMHAIAANRKNHNADAM
jgi:hypothetical protein